MKKLFLLAFVLFGVNQAQALKVGDSAPCVVLEQIAADGMEFEGCIRDMKNSDQKYTLIEFFSITCSACKQNNPIINRLAAEIKDKAHLRFVSIDRSIESVRTYRMNNKSQFPTDLAIDNERFARRAYDVVSTPTLYVLDKSFTVRFKHTGVLNQESINAIKAIVKD